MVEIRTPRVVVHHVYPDSADGCKLRDAGRRIIAEHRASTPGRDELIRRIMTDRADLMRRLADR